MPLNFSIISHAIGSVATFFVIGFLGYLMNRRGWFSKDSLELFSKMVMVGALPVYLVYNIDATFSRDELPTLARSLAIPALSIGINLGIGHAVARLMRLDPGRRGIVCASYGFANSLYIGLPINLALFGETATPYVLTYYFANAALFWTVGNYLLASDGSGGGTGLLSPDSAKKILSPPIAGMLCGVVLLLLGLRLPAFLANAGKSMGGIITPLVVISIGATVGGMGISRDWLGRDMLLVALGRFIVSPLVIIALTEIFAVPALMRMVYIIQASLPVMSNVGILAAYHRKGDADFAAVAISMTTLLSFLTVPLYMAVATGFA